MRKVLKTLPSIKQAIIVMAVCFVLGGVVTGFQPRMFFSLLIGFLILVMITIRNYDPMG